MSQSLQKRMALFGFESNDDYSFPIRCLLNSPLRGIRCLNLEGEPDRHRTAFANALARALDYPHILYHDFSQKKPPPPEVILPPSKDESGREEPPIDPFDDLMSKACALSEGEKTLAIIDQLHEADFREHIRLSKFLDNMQWQIKDSIYYANPHYLLVLLISDQPLYHSLQKASYRLWVNRLSQRLIPYLPKDFSLGEEAREIMQRLDQLFRELGASPTHSEYQHLLHDLQWHVRTREQLQSALYAWFEGVDRQSLQLPHIQPLLDTVIDALPSLVGMDDVEILAPTDLT
ncbi:MAG: hypothetical protein HQL47_08980 [Gammaproteobacteria bacterium]|nr:hypothetical protein [Gammaproteobacteria bacterium]